MQDSKRGSGVSVSKEALVIGNEGRDATRQNRQMGSARGERGSRMAKNGQGSICVDVDHGAN